ncbi:MAG TPA: hypothetical protein VFB75_19655 [Burkholderiales bacterium]|nr:hypothetical protein [Burkholderiales bacterium]
MTTAAISASEYRMSLLEIYGRYQGVLALREACNTAFPQSRADNDKAFTAWQTRHKKSHEELDQRISMMIRAYSKDDKDYARNFGKYQGAFLKQREEAKLILLENRPELEIRCKGLPQFLQSRESDLETEFANEWLVLRQWQMPAR